MAAVLTTASALVCPHGAPVLISASQRLLTVDGQPVLVRADLLAAQIPACPHRVANLSQIPCQKITSVDAGLATTLTVGGEPVALATARGKTLSDDHALVSWRVSTVNQSKLEAA